MWNFALIIMDIKLTKIWIIAFWKTYLLTTFLNWRENVKKSYCFAFSTNKIIFLRQFSFWIPQYCSYVIIVQLSVCVICRMRSVVRPSALGMATIREERKPLAVKIKGIILQHFTNRIFKKLFLSMYWLSPCIPHL